MTSTHPHKTRARQAVADVFRWGLIGLLKRGSCEVCGRGPEELRKGRRIVQAHHDSYEPGQWLDVRFRCGLGGCHAAADAETDRDGRAT